MQEIMNITLLRKILKRKITKLLNQFIIKSIYYLRCNYLRAAKFNRDIVARKPSCGSRFWSDLIFILSIFSSCGLRTESYHSTISLCDNTLNEVSNNR